MNKVRLVTSNLNKLKEFIRLSGGLDVDIQHGEDLKEVKSEDSIEVAIYKSLEAGEGAIVEDTILKVNGEEITDIRYRLSELSQIADSSNCKLEWITTLALHNGYSVALYQGVTHGTFKDIKDVPNDAFGFDPFFVPDGASKTLYELEKDGCKDDFSARKNAIQNLILDKKLKEVEINSIPPWKGEYQS
ncbi:non-canonical purine NTP pyrophosphatase [Vibrio parahaemolyticus]|uniref:non-canonical purine NTP pyrophosphatase n=1 Tax=Vibrio parahaemolyticus TaxID=670 RepID=UPI0006C8C749